MGNIEDITKDRLYNYVEYTTDKMTFITHMIFDDLVEEILSNRGFALLYRRDPDLNIRRLSKYASLGTFEIEEVTSVRVYREDLGEWESLHVSTFDEKALAEK
jgi:hypothetical protein